MLDLSTVILTYLDRVVSSLFIDNDDNSHKRATLTSRHWAIAVQEMTPAVRHLQRLQL